MLGFTWRALSLVLIAGHAAAQSTWYVNELASAPFDGTMTQPFQSIAQAVVDPDTRPGDTVLVLPGMYARFQTSKALQIRSTDGPLVTGIGGGVHSGHGDHTVLMSSHAQSVFEGFTVWGSTNHAAVRGQSLRVSRCILLGLQASNSIGLSQTPDCGLESYADHCWISGFTYGVLSSPYCEAYAYNSILHANTFDLEGDGAFNHFGNPQVVDAAGHDFHLLASSPCFNAGDPNAPLDPDGTRADIGPFPFDPGYQPHTTYCTAKVNSLGCTPAIQAQNTASISSPRPFWISCTNQISQRSGLMSYGFAPLANPYQGGFKCIASPTRRSGLLSAGGNLGAPDCSGVFTVDFNEVVRSGQDPALTLGQEVFCQFWARDPASSFSSNRSNAIRFRIAP